MLTFKVTANAEDSPILPVRWRGNLAPWLPLDPARTHLEAPPPAPAPGPTRTHLEAPPPAQSPGPAPHSPARTHLEAPPLTAPPTSPGSWPRPQSGSRVVIGAVLATATPWSSSGHAALGHKGHRTTGVLGEEHGRFARGRRRLSPRGRRPSPALSGLRPAGGWEGGCRTGTACQSPDRSLVSVGCGPSTSDPPRGSGKLWEFSFRAGRSLLTDAETGPERLGDSPPHLPVWYLGPGGKAGCSWSPHRPSLRLGRSRRGRQPRAPLCFGAK